VRAPARGRAGGLKSPASTTTAPRPFCPAGMDKGSRTAPWRGSPAPLLLLCQGASCCRPLVALAVPAGLARAGSAPVLEAPGSRVRGPATQVSLCILVRGPVARPG
jgi:hypothetical protein